MFCKKKTVLFTHILIFRVLSLTCNEKHIKNNAGHPGGCYSLYVIKVGKLQMTMFCANCVEYFSDAMLRDLWNIAITKLPAIEDKLFKP